MKQIAINGVIVVIGLATGFAVSKRPWQAYQTQKKETEHTIVDLRRSEVAREELLRRAARYNSPIGREELARNQGWAKPGEISADRGK